eukprot:s580_g3.t1
MRVFLDTYAAGGLDINKEPLGALLPAPRLDGSFCARPLTTSEAAAWLRGLLHGTGYERTWHYQHAHHFLQFLLFLQWKQTQKLIRAMFWVKQAVDESVEIEELQSVKEEQLDAQMLEAAADKLSLFPVEVVAAGVVEIESSSGSESSSSSSESESSSTTEELGKDQPVRYVEHVPQDMDFYKHAKSGIVHGCKLGGIVSNCRLTMSSNYKKLARQFHFKHPK